MMTYSEKNDDYLLISEKDSSDLEILTDRSIQDELPYPELQDFLQQIENQAYTFLSKPYSSSKNQVMFYKLVFIVFGFIFLGLGWIVLANNPNWIYHHLLFDQHSIQLAVVGFTWMLALLSSYIGWSIATEREVLNFLAYRAQNSLKRNYMRRRSQFSFFRILPFSDCYRKNDSLKLKYIESLEKISHTKEDYIHLLNRITSQPSLDKTTKETLYNQTLLKYKEFTDGIVNNLA